MDYKDSYFRLIIDDNEGVFIDYYPPMEDGKPLAIEDVTNYLQKNKITDFDLKRVNEIIHSDKREKALICRTNTYSINEYMEITTTPDRMYAVARFYPPSDKGSRLSFEEIHGDLKASKIVFGINDAVIKSFISNPQYMSKIIIAAGQKPVQGQDAQIEYKFETDRKVKPKLNEDGTVDFHQLNNISHIEAGDVLAVLHPEDKGTPGKDVYGNVVNPRKVNRLALRYGNNIKLSEDGLSISSMVDGHVTLEGDRVSVSNIYEVAADVDNSTGDIDYNGSVTIKGNVRTGFKVRARGDIEIFGVVEGAAIIADGNVILHRGISGMGRCQVVARGNLVSKFIESATVAVNGYIETDTILHSQVSAKGDIFVRGKNGDIIGGTVRSTTLIEASSIGSPMGANTSVEVGTDPAIIDRANELKKEIQEKTKEKDGYTQTIVLLKKKLEMGKLDKARLPMMQKTAKDILSLEDEIAKLSEEYEKLYVQMSGNANAKINVIKNIYQGTKVSISGDYILIHSSVSHCTYKKEKSEIKAVPL